MKQQVSIDVQGMTCQGCVASVTRILKAAPGVTDAVVSLERHEARIDFEADQISVADLRQAVIDAGYESVAS